jgi:hypothetical protein
MSELYIKGKGYEILPNIFVENFSKIYPKDTLRGKMQWLAFTWASVYANSIKFYDLSIELLKKYHVQNHNIIIQLHLDI